MLRFDQFQLKPSHRTDEGYLLCSGSAARAGVLVYRNPDGTARRELVPPEELQRTDSIGSVALKPVTDGHPAEGRVDATNARDLQRGVSLQNVQYADGYVNIELIITDQELANDVERGDKKELSLGYHLDGLDETPGVHPVYGRYDAIQRGRRCNHVAVVRRGRAGSNVAIRTDAADDSAFYREDTCGGYWSITDPDLPQRVKELDDEEKCHWVDVYAEEYWSEARRKQAPSKRDEAAQRAADVAVFGSPREDTMTVQKKDEAKKHAADQDSKKESEDQAQSLSDLLGAAADAARDLAVKVSEARADADEEEGGEGGDEEDALQAIMDAMGGFVEHMDALKAQADEFQAKHDEKAAQLDALLEEFRKPDNEDASDMETEDKEKRGDAAPEQAPVADPERARLDWYNERRELEAAAERYDSIEGVGALTNADLKCEIVKAHFGEERVDGKNDAEIQGLYVAAQEIARSRSDSYQGVGDRVIESRQDGARSGEEKARQNYLRNLTGRNDSADTDANAALQKFAEMIANASK